MNYSTPPELLPSGALKRQTTIFSVFLIIYLSSMAWMGVNPLMLITEFQYVQNLANEMFPPNLTKLANTPNLWDSILTNLAMAFLGTILGGGAAIVIAFFGAKNVVSNPVMYGFVRFIMVFNRIIPAFIILLLLQVLFGVGSFSGALALAIGSFGLSGKLFADAIEQVDAGPLESLETSGATRSQIVRYGIVPQVLPAIISNLFFLFDVNMRRAIELGMFGGGGLGFEIHKASRTMQYKDQLALIIVTIVLIGSMEKLSDLIRNKLIVRNL